MNSLRVVEKKLLGAMVMHSDDDMIVKAKHNELAKTMGYKSSGGAITFALQALEMKNYITKHEKGYQILL